MKPGEKTADYIRSLTEEAVWYRALGQPRVWHQLRAPGSGIRQVRTRVRDLVWEPVWDLVWVRLKDGGRRP